MTAISTALTTAFVGLARRQVAAAAALRREAPILPLPCRGKTATVSARSYTIVAKRTAGIGLGRLTVSRRSGACSRRFVASATATEDGSDVLTKIPPDERIPATIITGFLGSGKVKPLIELLFLLSVARWVINLRCSPIPIL